MFPMHYLVIILQTTVTSVLSMDKLHVGNFGYFGNCVIKFLRLGNDLKYIDLTEHLIHVNDPANLIYTVNGRSNFSNFSVEDDKRTLDFKFYEICTITVFVKFGTDDNEFVSKYLFFTRDAHRSLAHSVFILISQRPQQYLSFAKTFFGYYAPLRIFAIDIKLNSRIPSSFFPLETEWFFLCRLCKNIFAPVNYTPMIKTLANKVFQVHGWRSDVSIAAHLPALFIPGGICARGQYYIAPHGIVCPSAERVFWMISGILNVTFVQVPNTLTHQWGYFHQDLRLNIYNYHHVNALNSFRYSGYHAIYCNFNVWSENTDLAVWVSPFTQEVYLGCILIVSAVAIFRIFSDSLKPEKIWVNFELMRSMGEAMFTICSSFVRQTLMRKYVSKWIFVSMLFTSFMLIAQYEFYLTTNLVIPPRYQIFRTMSEFFANGYTLVYESEEGENMMSVRIQLQEEFVQKSLGKFPHDKTIVIRYVIMSQYTGIIIAILLFQKMIRTYIF